MRRARTAVICSLALAATLAVATPALAGRGPIPQNVGPRGFGSPAQIPWASVGSGWVLTDWFAGRKFDAPEHLVLTNQVGDRYIVMKKSGPLAKATLLDWSGNGQSALFDNETNAGITTIYVVDLRTGAIEDSFVLPTSNTANFQTAGFTRPDGLGVLVDIYTNHAVLTRYSLGGQLQMAYPSAFAGVGRIQGQWASRPDGLELALGAAHGLAVVANDGTPIAQIRLPGSNYCDPKSWWSPTVILASCAIDQRGPRLFEFDVAGGTAKALTGPNTGNDYGDIGGWRVDRHVYVEVSSACGYVYLAKLVGATPVMVHVPGVPDGHSEYVVGATPTAIALTAQVACQGGPSLLWYTPALNSTRVVLGPPVTGGIPGTSFAYMRSYG